MGINLTLFLIFILALVISIYEIPGIVRVVSKLGILDFPNERSSATKSIPTLGGIAIFISFIISSTIGLSRYDLPEMKFIVPALVLILFVGVIDDILGSSPLKKLIFQIIVACMLVFMAKRRFTNLHGTFGFWDIDVVSGSILSCFTIIVIMNAFNLIDGIDGLAAGVTMVIAAVLGGWFYISGHFSYAVLSFSLVGSVLGFFYFNVYGTKYKIFMGDTGSLVLGTLIAILVIQFNEQNIDQTQAYAMQSVPALSFGILSYPLMDLMRVILIRISYSRHLFHADKNHFHHRLLTLGLSHQLATYSILGFNILFIIAVFYLNRIGFNGLMFYILAGCILLVIIPAYFIQKRKLIREDDPVQQLLMPGTSYEVNSPKKSPGILSVERIKESNSQL